MSSNYKFHNTDGAFYKFFRYGVDGCLAERTGRYLHKTNTKPFYLTVIDEKIDYVYNNPVEEGLVFREEDYFFIKTADYAGEKGILEYVIVVK